MTLVYIPGGIQVDYQTTGIQSQLSHIYMNLLVILCVSLPPVLPTDLPIATGCLNIPTGLQVGKVSKEPI